MVFSLFFSGRFYMPCRRLASIMLSDPDYYYNIGTRIRELWLYTQQPPNSFPHGISVAFSLRNAWPIHVTDITCSANEYKRYYTEMSRSSCAAEPNRSIQHFWFRHSIYGIVCTTNKFHRIIFISNSILMNNNNDIIDVDDIWRVYNKSISIHSKQNGEYWSFCSFHYSGCYVLCLTHLAGISKSFPIFHSDHWAYPSTNCFKYFRLTTSLIILLLFFFFCKR